MKRNTKQNGQSQSKNSNRSEAAQKAAETRKSHDPDAFRKMGQKGGFHSSGGKNRNEK